MSRYYPEGTTAQDIDDLAPSQKDERIAELTKELLEDRVNDPEWLSDHTEWMAYRYEPTEIARDAATQKQALQLMEAIAAHWKAPTMTTLMDIGAMVVNNTLESLRIECERDAKRRIEADDANAEEAAREGGYYRRPR